VKFLNKTGRKLKTCELCRDRDRKFRESKKEYRKEKNKIYNEENKDKIKAQQKIYNEKNKEKKKLAAKEWREKNKCEHGRVKNICKDCGTGYCQHNRNKTRCKECGTGYCQHNRQYSQCKECKGGSICEHDKRRSRCKECKGGSICEHDKQKSTCKICDPIGHLRGIVSGSVRKAIVRGHKIHRSQYYLGCDIDHYKEYIESKFKEGMTWDNYGEWHIDHIVPIKYENPTLEETTKRLHWTNTQPLWAIDNMIKGNRFIG
jgi:hypothetical protein